MKRSLRALIPALLLVSAGTALRAEPTMRLTGKVTTKDGKPVAGAKVAIKKLDTGWRREVLTDVKGVYSQAGLQPDKDPNFEITITKEGFATTIRHTSVPLQGSSYSKDFFLYLPGETPVDSDKEQAPPAPVSPRVDPALKEDTDARAAFNAAAEAYNAQRYADALPNLQTAYTGMTHAIATMQDETAKAESQSLLPAITKAYGIALYKSGKTDEAIAPLSQLVDADPKNPKNADAMQTLVDIYTKKKDETNRLKYQGILNAATGTSPASGLYSDAAEAFNANKFKEAKQYLMKAIAVDPSYPDTQYLLGLVELNEGNISGAKARFKKYLELAPNGKHASEIKEMGM